MKQGRTFGFLARPVLAVLLSGIAVFAQRAELRPAPPVTMSGKPID